MLSLQRAISINVVALKVILCPMDNVDSFKDITSDEGNHENPLNSPAEDRKGNPTSKGVIPINKLYDLQNFNQAPRNVEPIGPSL